ncbi:MAG: cofactor-independent phosphoglycerate mutase [Candidatus Omnitrophota bacterium]
MKYAVLVADGMADYPLKELDGHTPLEVARKPHIDFMAHSGMLGRVRTIPLKASPGSDVANISILGYDPARFYTGRGPLEAANLGVELEDDDVAFRCNLITAADNKLIDYSAGHIGSEEAANLIKFLDQRLGSERFRFYAGVSYRHLMVAKAGSRDGLDILECKPPHDILNRDINVNLPSGKGAEAIIGIMQESRALLENHEINLVRVDLKENPANMIWLWGQGKKPSMPSFQDKYGIKGSVISAVDLIKGLGRILGLGVVTVEGATGYYDTNYQGKGEAALKCLKKEDFVFVHVEAPDEAGHNGDIREKIMAIERFDQFIVGPLVETFKGKEDFRMIVLPDHATPISLRTHTPDVVPFVAYGSGIPSGNATAYNEKEAVSSDLYFDKGYELMDYLIKGTR